MVANASTAFFLNLAVFLLIGKTSALTMNNAGVIKVPTMAHCDILTLIYSDFRAPYVPTPHFSRMKGVQPACGRPVATAQTGRWTG